MDRTSVKAGEVEGSYLTDGYTLRSWLLTTDHKRIALLYLGTITVFFFIGGSGGGAGAPEPDRPARAPGIRRSVQPALHHAWRRDGLVLPRAGGAGDARQFSDSA